jgi:penicillin-binding protein 2
MGVVVTLFFIALLGRLCQLQILEGEHYTRRAERNFIDEVIVEAPRGRIFASGGEVLATNRPAYTLYVTPIPRVTVESDDPKAPAVGSRVPLDDSQIEALAELIDFVDDDDRDAFLTKIAERRADERNGKYAFAVRSNLSWEEYARIETRRDSLGEWIEIRESARRYYPKRELAAFLTGYVGEITPEGLARSAGAYRPGDRVGKTGIERQWENYLRGRLGKRSRVVDVVGRSVAEPPPDALAALPPDESPIPGQDIHLTIDLELQQVAADAFAGKPAGAVVALEPETGRILAMVSVPAIDPNRWQQPIPRADYQAWAESPFKPFIDRTVQEHFFPGSTYKVVSALAALDDPTFDPEREIVCDRFVKYGGRKFKCTHKHGPVDLHQAIVQSCNVYFYTLAMENTLALDRQEIFARRTGLGERTGLGLNSETKGRIPTEAFEAREGTYQKGVQLNSAIGQGNVTATVLQIAQLYGAVANGGQVMTPYLVDRIETHDRKLVFASTPQVRRDLEAIVPSDRRRIHQALIGVVNDPLGTAYSERLPNITVAGKTGTAQVGAEERRKKKKDKDEEPDNPDWDTTKDHAWFAAYAPAENPRIAVAAFVEHGGVGADAAAPIAMKVIEHYLSRTNDPSSAPRRPAGVAPPLPGSEHPGDAPIGPSGPRLGQLAPRGEGR